MHRVKESDAWVLGSYRRLESLVVPAFTDYRLAATREAQRSAARVDLVALETDLPRDLLPFRDFVHGAHASAGDFAVQLSLVLRYLAAPLRYEPENLYFVHRAVPSPRCLFPCRILVVTRTTAADAPVVYAYHPNHHALEPLGPRSRLGALLGDGNVAVIGVGQFWMLADKYGEFSPFVLSLEAGMLRAQADHLARLVGWRRADSAAAGKALDEALDCGALETTVFAIAAIASGDDIEVGAAHRASVATWRPTAGLAERFPRLDTLAHLFGADARPMDVQIGTRAPIHGSSSARTDTAIDVLEVMRRRTSGNDKGGWAPAIRITDRALLDQLMHDFNALRSQRFALQGEASLSVYVALLNRSGYPIGLYDDRLQAVPLPLDERQFVRALQGALPSRDFRYNMAAFVLSVLIVAPAAGHAASKTPGIRDAHVAAGAVAQDFCLAAAAQDLFARPVRMFQEIELETAWRLDGRLVYQILAGFNRSSNLAMELL